MNYKDTFGVDLFVGDYVLYAKSSYIRVAKILKFDTPMNQTLPAIPGPSNHSTCDLITISDNKTFLRKLGFWANTFRRDTLYTVHIDCLVKWEQVSQQDKDLINERLLKMRK